MFDYASNNSSIYTKRFLNYNSAAVEREWEIEWEKNPIHLRWGENGRDVISINLVNFNANKSTEEPHSVCMLCDIKTGIPITDKITVHFIEFPKYKNGASFNTEDLELWAKYFI